MTFDEAKTRLAEICAGIVQQNHELMEKMDEPDFDPGIGFDNTKNNAGYKLTDFFDILKAFPYGNVPGEVTDEVVGSTDALLKKMREKYGRSEAVLGELISVGQAFRDSKRIWRIRNPIANRDPPVYEARLDEALHRILRALDDLNYELNLLTFKPPASVAETAKGHRRGRAYGDCDPTLHKERKEVVAEMRRRKIATRMAWTKIVAEMRHNSSYSARMRGRTDATWIRYAKSGFSGQVSSGSR